MPVGRWFFSYLFMEFLSKRYFMINFTQLIVQTDKDTIDWLESQGYANPHNLPNNYTFSVFIVDLLRNTIFGTNTTCMAASGSCGNRPIVLKFEQLKKAIKRLPLNNNARITIMTNFFVFTNFYAAKLRDGAIPPPRCSNNTANGSFKQFG